MPLKLDILANTRQFVQEMKRSGASVEDVSDSLDDMAKDGNRSVEKLEKSFKDMSKEAQKADKQVESIGKGGFVSASEASGEFKQEALQNFSEVTSSFDGSMSSIQDLAQGTLGGLAASGLPGIGLAAGAAAGAIGLIGAAFAGNDEAAQLSIEKVNEWADKYIEAKGRALTEDQILSEAQRILTDDAERYADALTLQEATGANLGLVIRALSGDSAALAEVNTRLSDAAEESAKQLAEQETQVDKSAGKVYDFADAVEKSQSILSTQASEMDSGAAKARAFGDAALYGADQARGLGGAVTGIPDVKNITVGIDATKAYQALAGLEQRLVNGMWVTVNARKGSGWE
jgi:hypothetical protein